MSRWTEILTAEQINEHFERFARLMPEMARAVRADWEGMTIGQLCAAKDQAWQTNEDDRYQMAASFLAIRQAEQDASARIKLTTGWGWSGQAV